MNSYSSSLPIAILFSVFVYGCSTNASDGDERTYPEALNLEVVSVGEFKSKVDLPDSSNIEARVISIRECPPTAMCIIPDGIEVTGYDNSDTLNINLMNPSQFKMQQSYTFSLLLKKRREERLVIDLLGYSRLQ